MLWEGDALPGVLIGGPDLNIKYKELKTGDRLRIYIGKYFKSSGKILDHRKFEFQWELSQSWVQKRLS